MSTSTQSLSREDDGSQKPKRGFKNLFGLKKTDNGKDSRGPNTSAGPGGNSSDGINLRPIKK